MVAKAKNSLKEPQKHQRRRGYDLATVILAIFSEMPYASKFVLSTAIQNVESVCKSIQDSFNHCDSLQLLSLQQAASAYNFLIIMIR